MGASVPTLPKVRGPVFCGAQRRHQGSDCRRPSGWGTNHPGWGRCKLHGGSTDSHVESAQIAQATEVARLFGVPREVNPVDGIMEGYWQTMGILDAVEAMCVRLMPDDVTWGIVKERRVGEANGDGDDGLAPIEREYAPGVNIWVKLLAEWSDRAFRQGEAILKLDIASRQVEYSASQTAALAGVLLSSELGLSEEQRRVAARLLRGMEQRAAIEAT